MIIEISGDLLQSQANALVQGVAPNDHCDHGLALQLRERWPAMVKDFRHYCRQEHPACGTLWQWPRPDGVRIYNLLVQEPSATHDANPGKASLVHVNHALKNLRHQLEADKVKSVALPKLATGVGGLKWQDVHALIVQHLGSLSVPVYLYTTYQPGVLGKEVTR